MQTLPQQFEDLPTRLAGKRRRLPWAVTRAMSPFCPAVVPGSIRRWVSSWCLAACVWIGCQTVSRAQWSTQTTELVAGWNAVYLHVDASHATLEELIASDPGNPIQEVWLWRPALPTGQFIESPQVPVSTDSQWTSWERADGPGSDLQRLAGNAAYLVRVSAGAPDYQWNLRGKVLPPSNRWTLTGLNFVGFPSLRASPPSFETFLTPAPDLLMNAEIYVYNGGDLSAANPSRLVAFRNRDVRRDQAYWMRAGETFNDYFGPFEVRMQGSTGVHFGDAFGQISFRIRNLTPSVLTIQMEQLASEAPPPGEEAIQGDPPLLVRGALNTEDLTYTHTALADGPEEWTLSPAGQVGSEVEIVVGVNRSALSGAPGDLFAGILRLTDSLNLSEVDLPVTARIGSTAGLWVGAAAVDRVGHYLKPYATAASETEFEALLERLNLVQGENGTRYEWDPATGRVLVFGGPDNRTGSYLLDGPIRTETGAVARPFTLRMIVHNDGTDAVLLQRVYQGMNPDNIPILTTRESLLDAGQLAGANRVSAVHLPVSRTNTPWPFNGAMEPGGSMSVTVATAFNDHASSPFLHTYHPDHDNLGAAFQTELGPAVESYNLRRRMTLNFRAGGDDFASLTRGALTFEGDYVETMTLESADDHVQDFNVLGSFVLHRVSDIATLATQ